MSGPGEGQVSAGGRTGVPRRLPSMTVIGPILALIVLITLGTLLGSF